MPTLIEQNATADLYYRIYNGNGKYEKISCFKLRINVLEYQFNEFNSEALIVIIRCYTSDLSLKAS